MPWIKDSNGEAKYKPSIYAKEELPTWDEVYNQFYKQQIILYDPNDENQVNDKQPYWGIPHNLYIITMICNQFNKMIFEDGFRDDLIRILKEKNIYVSNLLRDIRFTCEALSELPTIIRDESEEDKNYKENCREWDNILKQLNVGINGAPPIYMVPLPSGKTNPFVTNDHPRINVNEITPSPEGIVLYPIIDLDLGDSPDATGYTIYTPMPTNESERVDFDIIIEVMMDQYKKYFEGEAVGWKDENGNLIERGPTESKCESGADPAL